MPFISLEDFADCEVGRFVTTLGYTRYWSVSWKGQTPMMGDSSSVWF